MSAVVAIVGRPNVGKSTLFNRLVGKRKAIESAIPGTTRDLIYQSADVDGYSVLLVDTGGIEMGKPGSDIEENVQEQSKVAISGADVIVFVLNVREDLTSQDFHAASLLRKSGKSVIVVANKCDNEKLSLLRYSFIELGFGDPVAVTALHSFGLDEVESRIGDELKDLGFQREELSKEKSDRIRVAFLGRPNVGKSTMINALFGKKRVVVSAKPGTTRDATELPFEYNDVPFTLVDTAGIRRSGKIGAGLEKYSILRTLQSIEQVDIAVLMLDFEEGVTNQDCHVSQSILEEKKGLILVVNKIDVFQGKALEEKMHNFIHKLQEKMDFVPWAPVVFTSGLARKNIFQVLDLARSIFDERTKKISQMDLDIWLEMTLSKHPPTGKRGKQRFKILKVVEDDVNPPCFIFYCEWPEVMHFSYSRYLENELRSRFGFNGTSVRFIFRKPGERSSRRTKKVNPEIPNSF